MLRKLLPRESIFFALFNEQADLIARGIDQFAQGLQRGGRTADWSLRIKAVEEAADAVAHRIFTTLNNTFVTPFDREDIQLLAYRMDDVIDFVEKAGARMDIYALADPPPLVDAMIDVLKQAFDRVAQAAGMLSDWRNREDIFTLCIEINQLENKGDQLLREALKGLFAQAADPDPLYVLKAKDIYESLEDAIDRCEDLANIIETIVIKNA